MMEELQKLFGSDALTWAQFVQKLQENPQIQLQTAAAPEPQQDAAGSAAPDRQAAVGQTDVARLQAALAAMQQKYQTDMTQTRLDSAIDAALTAAHARSPKAVRALLNMDAIHMVNGQVQGLDEQIALLRQREPYLFDQTTPAAGASAVTTGGRHGTQSAAPLDKFMAAAMAAAGI